MKRSVLYLTVLTLVVMAVPAFAATQQSQFTVQASVSNNCTISSTGINFGSYDPITANSATGADAYANGTVTVRCTRGAAGVWIGLDAGSNSASASGTTRAMSAGGGNFLSYDLYLADPNPAPGAVWGNTAATGMSYSPASSAATNLTVYGRTPKGQDAAAGSYSDTITATINY